MVKKFQHVGQGHLWVTKFHEGVGTGDMALESRPFTLQQMDRVGNKEVQLVEN